MWGDYCESNTPSCSTSLPCPCLLQVKNTRRAVLDLAGCVGAAARLGADWVTATQHQAEWGQQGLSDEEVEERLEQDRMAGLGELGCWALGLFSLEAAGAAGDDAALAAPYMAVRITQMGHGKPAATAVSHAQLHQIMLCMLLPHACLSARLPYLACWVAAALRHKTCFSPVVPFCLPLACLLSARRRAPAAVVPVQEAAGDARGGSLCWRQRQRRKGCNLCSADRRAPRPRVRHWLAGCQAHRCDEDQGEEGVEPGGSEGARVAAAVLRPSQGCMLPLLPVMLGMAARLMWRSGLSGS